MTRTSVRRPLPGGPAPPPATAPLPPWLLRTAAEIAGLADVEPDEDGDVAVALRPGGEAVFLRAVAGSPTVTVWTALDAPALPGDRFHELANRWNGRFSLVKVLWTGDLLAVEAGLLVVDLAPSQVREAVTAVTVVGDLLDDELAVEATRGRADAARGGYL